MSVTTFVRNGDVQLCVQRIGKGKRHLLFAHGWISARRMWYDVASALDPGEYTMHLMDFRGCGSSDRPMTGHDLQGYASDLRTVIASIGAPLTLDRCDDGPQIASIGAPLTLVGHSMGGKIAQYVAAERIATLQRLVLVAPGSAKAVRFNDRHRQMSLDAFGSRERIEAFQRAAMVRAIPPATLERIVDDALTGQREAWFGWYDHGRSVDFSDRLAEINVPTVAVAGGSDPLAPPSRVKSDVAEKIDGCLFVMLRNAGHNLPVETPAEVAGVIERFK